MPTISGYTEIDQSDEYAKSKIREYTNIKGKTIKDAFIGIDKGGYTIMEIRFTDDLTLQIREKSQTGEFEAWVYG
jgi:hypothetical protein